MNVSNNKSHEDIIFEGELFSIQEEVKEKLRYTHTESIVPIIPPINDIPPS